MMIFCGTFPEEHIRVLILCRVIEMKNQQFLKKLFDIFRQWRIVPQIYFGGSPNPCSRDERLRDYCLTSQFIMPPNIPRKPSWSAAAFHHIIETLWVRPCLPSYHGNPLDPPLPSIIQWKPSGSAAAFHHIIETLRIRPCLPSCHGNPLDPHLPSIIPWKSSGSTPALHHTMETLRIRPAFNHTMEIFWFHPCLTSYHENPQDPPLPSSILWKPSGSALPSIIPWKPSGSAPAFYHTMETL